MSGSGVRPATRLQGYAGAFVDTSRDPRTGEEMDQQAADGLEDASRWIVNVAVTGEVSAAEAALREVWGGPLCVFRAEHTEQQLLRIQRQPGITGSGSGIDSVDVSVVWDDGVAAGLGRRGVRRGAGARLVVDAARHVSARQPVADAGVAGHRPATWSTASRTVIPAPAAHA